MKINFFSILTTRIWLLLGIVSLLLFTALVAGLLFKPAYSEAAYRFFDSGFLMQAERYQETRVKIFLFKQLLTWIFFLLAALVAYKYFASIPHPAFVVAAAFFALLFAVYYLGNLPLEYYQGFILEHNFGLSAQSSGSWLEDFLKSRTISIIIATAALTGLYIAMRAFPRNWWWLTGIAFSFFIILGTYLFPLLIDPLFYKFEPLEDQQMRASIMEMANQAGINIEEVLVADASKKTRKVNAYFTGMGNTKRIVIYDTLLDSFTKAETLTVIAHEMGHWQHAHILKGVLLSSAAVFSTFFLFSYSQKNTGLIGDIRSVFLALFFFSLFSFCILPIGNSVSRHFERQADRAALQLTGDPTAFIRLKQNLATANLSQVEPHPLVKTILYTHPTILERINIALKAIDDY